jgi:hypothetical protein
VIRFFEVRVRVFFLVVVRGIEKNEGRAISPVPDPPPV